MSDGNEVVAVAVTVVEVEGNEAWAVPDKDWTEFIGTEAAIT